MRPALRFIAVGLISAVGIAFGVTLRVPQDYSSIQAALDSLQDGDTVLVAVGVYAEALRGPPRSGYVLRGDVVPDTGNYPRPVVDPSSLPRPDTVTCLILDPLSAGIIIEDFAFRNGREMYDTIPRRYTGGVVNYSRDLTVRRCLFDSTYGGVGGGTNLYLEDCRFEDNYLICARTDSGPITAVNCLFSCDGGGGYNVVARDYSSFRFCEFRDNSTGELLVAGFPGDSIIIEDCIFGPWANWWSALVITVRSGCVVRNCVFTDCVPGVSLVDILMDCSNDDPLPLTLSDNIFMNYVGGYPPYDAAITSWCQNVYSPSSFWGIMENNVFRDGQFGPPNPDANALSLEGGWLVRGNRFTRLDPPTASDVYAVRVDAGPVDTLVLRDNLFDADGLAASAYWYSRIDARWNWWGDSTGPYHPSLNPDGQGGEIGSGVIFDPWYPDTSFLAAPEPHAALPQAVSLDVYPNPFNATATLRLAVNQPGIFRVDLYNLLGQHVQQIWSGAVAYEKRIAFDGQALSSGLYFVRVYQPIGNHVLALQKIVIAK